ncbi:MAG: hypothetical protein M1828_005201 [Chrysothrix sp. TS-e1954]|nr:MAG: hypothetical protein M1828_005201 [Chrysothrix sp. TS-e1954]
MPSLKAATHPKILNKADSYELTLQTDDSTEYAYNGRRETSPETSCILVHNPESQSFTLEALHASYRFNLASKDPNPDGQDVSKQYPPIPLESTKTDKDERLQINGNVNGRSRANSVSAASSEAELFREELNGEPDVHNPFDYRRYINAMPPPIEDSTEPVNGILGAPQTPKSRNTSMAPTPARAGTPSLTPSKPATTPSRPQAVPKPPNGNTTAAEASTGKRARKPAMSAANKRVMKGILKPTPHAMNRKQGIEQRASQPTSVQESPRPNAQKQNATAGAPIPEVHLAPSSPPPSKRQKTTSGKTHDTYDEGLTIDMGEGISAEEESAAQREREARKKASMLGTPRSGVLGPVSFHSAAASAQASPALLPRVRTGTSKDHKAARSGLGIRMDDDIEEMDLGSPEHDARLVDQHASSEHTDDADVEDVDEEVDDHGHGRERPQRKDSFSLALEDAIEKERLAQGDDDDDDDDDDDGEDDEEGEEEEGDPVLVESEPAARRPVESAAGDSEESEEE